MAAMAQQLVNGVVEWVDNFEWHAGLPLSQSIWVPATASAVYVPAVLLLSRWARARKEAINMRAVTMTYNILITVLSFLTFLAAFVVLVQRLVYQGPKYLVCDADGRAMTGLLGFAGYVYYVSKFVELADTVFLALTRKNLGTLHLYHHAGMPIVTFLWVRSGTLMLMWMVVLNSLIHTFMYWYYFQCDRKIHVSWKRHLTTAQIVQLVTGLALSFQHLHLLKTDSCKGEEFPVQLSVVLNIVLISLFVEFYVREYMRGRKAPRKDAAVAKKSD
eukprot:m51a1_g581 putative fatty acid elongase 3 (274) ;mRNA; r:1609-2759